MTFLYFAYGSNLWSEQMKSRCPSARPVGRAVLTGWTPVYDKPSVDGSAKLNIRESPDEEVWGALYEIGDVEREDLDRAEPGYDPLLVEVVTPSDEPVEALTYQWRGEPSNQLPYDWYVAIVEQGAREHRLPDGYRARLVSPLR